MAGVQLTQESALGAAVLASQGKAIECWMEFTSRTRFCMLESAEDEDAAQVWLTCNGRRALASTSQVRVSQETYYRCLVALSDSQAVPGETQGQRMGRLASESSEMINARNFLAQLQTSLVAAQMANRGANSGSFGYYAGRGY